MSFSATEKQYQLSNGLSTTDFWVWHDDRIRNEGNITSDIARDRFKESRETHVRVSNEGSSFMFYRCDVLKKEEDELRFV